MGKWPKHPSNPHKYWVFSKNKSGQKWPKVAKSGQNGHFLSKNDQIFIKFVIEKMTKNHKNHKIFDQTGHFFVKMPTFKIKNGH